MERRRHSGSCPDRGKGGRCKPVQPCVRLTSDSGHHAAALFGSVPSAELIDASRQENAPVGQSTRRARDDCLSSHGSQNIPLYRNSDLSYIRNTLARDEGRIAIVTNRGLGSDGRDGVGRDWHCRAGDREQWLSRARHGADSVFAWLRRRAHATPRIPSEDVRGRRSRVVPTPGVLAPSLAVM